MTRPHRLACALAALLALTACASSADRAPVAGIADPPLAALPDPPAGSPLVFIAYGDMRFTDPAEGAASSPRARRALVARVAAERPAALFLNGDVPWHGGTVDDYRVYAAETEAWREARIPVFPALGNHEFAQCAEADCLEHWWQAFPDLRGRRWYAVALGSRVLAINLDSDSSLLDGSPQRQWLAAELGALSPRVRFVLISLHHPPVTDPQQGLLADHNARPNEIALATYLGAVARTSAARFIVSAGHVHNYARNERDGVVYLVSGGGGAKPYPLERSAEDLYQSTEFPNYHYLRFELTGEVLRAQMIRLRSEDAGGDVFDVRDRFEIHAKHR